MEFPIYKSNQLMREQMEGEFYNSEFADLISELIDRDELESSIEIGIAKKVRDEGTEGLSEKQSYHLQKIFDRYNDIRCSVCDDLIPLSEVLFLEGSMCSYHQHQWNKD
ncbi:hypothetical protein [Flavobacterium tyrosinilyticum]|uniref:hypothetical protein n=1 Tax=Flavobacterium tyrosinilyticum TaxID=1658740 RepID=UPI00202E1ACF|nr:hypothetical protein [Flavobacterium tyrosinilyticum]MCM0665328.1 hypothetical protein [Flavobacterium tyrosinilyticum]